MQNIKPILKDGEIECKIGENQPEYLTLLAGVVVNDPTRPVASEWVLSTEEIASLIDGGRLRLTVLTFGNPLQPVLLEVLDRP